MCARSSADLSWPGLCRAYTVVWSGSVPAAGERSGRRCDSVGSGSLCSGASGSSPRSTRSTGRSRGHSCADGVLLVAVGPVPRRRRMVLMAGVWRMPRGSPEGSPYCHGGDQARVRHGERCTNRLKATGAAWPRDATRSPSLTRPPLPRRHPYLDPTLTKETETRGTVSLRGSSGTASHIDECEALRVSSCCRSDLEGCVSNGSLDRVIAAGRGHEGRASW